MILMIIISCGWFMCRPREESESHYFSEPEIKLYLNKSDEVIKLELEEYLVGTVAAEMPASFNLEALKAQAVCARTYALRKLMYAPKYPRQADLSDDIRSCQAYVTSATYENWQPELVQKIRRAVRETRGEIMLYDNQPIDALYHSTCGGETESALNGWAKEVPYLQSVKCRYCRGTKHYQETSSISWQHVINSWGTKDIKVLTRTSTGRVKKLKIGSTEISGEQFRQKLSLPSTWFYLEPARDALIIRTYGYGHGSGMCQYGANGMANAGKNYKQILGTYYKNISYYRINY